VYSMSSAISNCPPHFSRREIAVCTCRRERKWLWGGGWERGANRQSSTPVFLQNRKSVFLRWLPRGSS
jgi:hypothetical protein